MILITLWVNASYSSECLVLVRAAWVGSSDCLLSLSRKTCSRTKAAQWYRRGWLHFICIHAKYISCTSSAVIVASIANLTVKMWNINVGIPSQKTDFIIRKRHVCLITRPQHGKSSTISSVALTRATKTYQRASSGPDTSNKTNGFQVTPVWLVTGDSDLNGCAHGS